MPKYVYTLLEVRDDNYEFEVSLSGYADRGWRVVNFDVYHWQDSHGDMHTLYTALLGTEVL